MVFGSIRAYSVFDVGNLNTWVFDSSYRYIRILNSSHSVAVPKLYQREGQPRMTENELTNDPSKTV